jgi:hypothetical protein
MYQQLFFYMQELREQRLSLTGAVPEERLARLRNGPLNEREFVSEFDDGGQSYFPGGSTQRDIVTLKKTAPAGTQRQHAVDVRTCVCADIDACPYQAGKWSDRCFFSRIHEDNSECSRDLLEIDSLPIHASYSEHDDGLWQRHVGVNSVAMPLRVVLGVLAGNLEEPVRNPSRSSKE